MATAAVTLVVRAANSIAISSALPSATPGTAYNFQLTASGGQGPYTYTVASGSTLPAGLSLSMSGVLSGTPTTSGTVTFSVTARDASGATGNQALTLNVAASTISIPNAWCPNGTVGTAYNLTLSPAGGLAPYTVTVVSGTLPSGLTLSTAGVFSGMPSTAGSLPIILRVMDANGNQVQQPYTIVVGLQNGILITTATLPAASVGQTYSATLQASGGVAPYTFSVASGNFPAGLMLSSTGAISGMVTAGGQFPITFRVTDANGTTATANLSLTAN